MRDDAGPAVGPTEAIEYWGHPYPYLSRLVERLGSSGGRRLLDKLTIDSISRRNPRNRDYMRALVATEGLSEADVVVADAKAPAVDPNRLKSAATILLLWPDGNGTGWWPVEQQVFRETPRTARILVMNGRRRRFELSTGCWFGYLLRRVVEKSLAGELAFFAVFVVTSPFLVAWDRLRGRA
jgi:hypothetical protein